MTPSLYFVGGYVRDKLLGIESKDIDFTFVLPDNTGTVSEGFYLMKSWMVTQGFQIFLETEEMFTIRAKFPNDHKFTGLIADFVLARKEIGYEKNSRRPILGLGTLEDDLIRRDFTLNAMAISEDGELVDLFGGQEDLKNLLMRTPLPAKQTMMDDPLRIMRCLRFNITKGFFISDEIWEAMCQPDILEKLQTTISPERIREEVYKMMKSDTARSLELFARVESHIPGFTRMIFSRGLWLKPSFEVK
jgi:tRNA nucleotidyltransferase/poly(A) polymerase